MLKIFGLAAAIVLAVVAIIVGYVMKGDSGNDRGSDQKFAGQIGPLSQLHSFEYEMTLTGFAQLTSQLTGSSSTNQSSEIQASGAYREPDRSRLMLHIGNQEIANVVIGDRQWVKYEGSWRNPIPANDAARRTLLSFWDQALGSGLTAVCPQGDTEKVNGVQTRRCELGPDDVKRFLQQFAGDDVPGALKDVTVRVWVAEKGSYPVRFDYSAKDAQTNQPFVVKFELKNVNGDIKIDPPI